MSDSLQQKISYLGRAVGSAGHVPDLKIAVQTALTTEFEDIEAEPLGSLDIVLRRARPVTGTVYGPSGRGHGATIELEPTIRLHKDLPDIDKGLLAEGGELDEKYWSEYQVGLTEDFVPTHNLEGGVIQVAFRNPTPNIRNAFARGARLDDPNGFDYFKNVGTFDYLASMAYSAGFVVGVVREYGTEIKLDEVPKSHEAYRAFMGVLVEYDGLTPEQLVPVYIWLSELETLERIGSDFVVSISELGIHPDLDLGPMFEANYRSGPSGVQRGVEIDQLNPEIRVLFGGEVTFPMGSSTSPVDLYVTQATEVANRIVRSLEQRK